MGGLGPWGLHQRSRVPTPAASSPLLPPGTIGGSCCERWGVRGVPGKQVAASTLLAQSPVVVAGVRAVPGKQMSSSCPQGHRCGPGANRAQLNKQHSQGLLPQPPRPAALPSRAHMAFQGSSEWNQAVVGNQEDPNRPAEIQTTAIWKCWRNLVK